ncbi:MAG: sugar-binding transcriptional regulator [Bacillota bacterium]
MRFDNRDMIKVAHYYYNVGLNQQEIADKFSMSRQRVNRLLKKAHDEGVVEIRVRGYDNSNAMLESELESKLQLREAVVVDSNDMSTLSATSIRYLKSIVQEGWTIGVSHGTSIAKLCDAPAAKEKHDIKIVQLTGGMNTINISSRPDEITLKFARIFGGEAHILFAPAITDNPSLRELIMEESQFQDIRKLYSNIDISVVAIGALVESNMLLQVGSLNKKDFDMLLGKDCVGDVILRFIDINGRIVDKQIDDRVMSIPLEDYLKIGLRVGVAYGPEKVRSIIGAINGKYINVLITDSDTAKLLIEARDSGVL